MFRLQNYSHDLCFDHTATNFSTTATNFSTTATNFSTAATSYSTTATNFSTIPRQIFRPSRPRYGISRVGPRSKTLSRLWIIGRGVSIYAAEKFVSRGPRPGTEKTLLSRYIMNLKKKIFSDAFPSTPAQICLERTD